MTIEEIEAEWGYRQRGEPDWFPAEYIPKLLAVAKAAKNLPDYLKFNYREEFEDLMLALDELEKEE